MKLLRLSFDLEITPCSGELFMQLAAEAGIPAGVINMVPGSVAAGEALVRHKLVEKVSFTGGPVTARKILAASRPISSFPMPISTRPVPLALTGRSA